MEVSTQHIPRVEALECKTCKKTFSQKSSLVRHLKWCGIKPRSVRQKACRNCALSRARCDLERPRCSRCASREEDCKYVMSHQRNDNPADATPRTSLPQVLHAPFSTTSQYLAANKQEDLTHRPFLSNTLCLTDPVFRIVGPYETNLETGYIVDGSSSDGISTPPTACNTPRSGVPESRSNCMIESLPQSSPSDTTPVLAKRSMQVLFRLFQTWPRMIVKGFQLPPIFHPSKNRLDKPLPQPLSNCFTIAKMWDGQWDGASAVVQETVVKETKAIFTNLQTYDEENLVAALQALLIYTIILIFPSHDQNVIPSVDPAIFVGLQQVVYYTAGTGLILHEETDHVVPPWEAWIHVNSKRRVLCSLYLLHWAYSVYHRHPSFNCDELGSIPAPTAKFLWQASTKEEWERLYKRWLVQWNGRQFLQKEFTYVKPGIALDWRTRTWLEDADELGVLFMSLWNTTNREPEFMLNNNEA